MGRSTSLLSAQTVDFATARVGSASACPSTKEMPASGAGAIAAAATSGAASP